jgi:hypothetical protein
MKFLYGVLLLVAQLTGCATTFCSLRETPQFEPHRLDVRGETEDVVPVTDDELIAVQLRAPSVTAIDIVRLGHGNEVVESLPPLDLADLAPSLIANQGKWWFSRWGEIDGSPHVVFVTGDEHPRKTAVDVSSKAGIAWLPFRGPEAGGILISIGDEQPSLHIDEITPAGVKSLGAFPRWETRANFNHSHPNRWSAQDIGAGRVAIVAVDGPLEDVRLRLRLVGSGKPTEFVVPTPQVALDLPISTASDGAGRIAIVGLTREAQIVGLVLDVDYPQAASARLLATGAARTVFGSPSVVWTDHGFLATWIRENGDIEACELSGSSASPVVVSIGHGAETRRPLRQMVQNGGEFVTFFWKDQNGGVIARKMPTCLNGAALAFEVSSFFCSKVQLAAELLRYLEQQTSP